MNGLDITNLKKMVDDKYISVQKHPSMDFFIYNYTQKAQFERVWNNETLQCRGLIMDKDNNIVSRPFPKFFNLSEQIENGVQLPAEDFIVTEKMDGSLGISYFDLNGYIHVATRGSFTSDQAIKGQKILHNKYLSLPWDEAYTYLFEVIYPDNRIVVDYAGMEDLVLLAVIDTYTGEEMPYEKLLEWFDGRLPVVKKYDAVADYKTLEQRPNAEGYVIHFPTTKQRFKVKFDEYVRLHRLVTGVNAKTIWEMLREGKDFEELLEKVPDEFFYWVKTKREELQDNYNSILWEAGKSMAIIDADLMLAYSDGVKLDRTSPQVRKAFAYQAKKTKYPSILFAMYDKKNYKDIIWKMVKPQADRPFREDL